MLQHVGPKPLIEPQKLKTKADWISAGRRIFEESDAPQLRTYDPSLISKVRSLEFYQPYNAHALPDGTIDILRWVPTKKGVSLSTLNFYYDFAAVVPKLKEKSDSSKFVGH